MDDAVYVRNMSYCWSAFASECAYRYLKSIDKFKEWTVSAWITPGGALFRCSSFMLRLNDSCSGLKLLLLHDNKQDDPIRHFLHEAWEAYVKVSLNAFYEAGALIRSPAFDARIKASAKKHL